VAHGYSPETTDHLGDVRINERAAKSFAVRRRSIVVGREMASYQPRIVKTKLGPEQRFDANILSVEDMDGGTIVALGDLVLRDGAPLNQGTPVHSLILQLSGDEVTVELNDQGNERSGKEIERFELSPFSFRVVFGSGNGPYSGRVSLSPEIEVFDANGDDEPVVLRSVRVKLSRVASTAAKLVEVEKDRP
jgi:hypothetical protein